MILSAVGGDRLDGRVHSVRGDDACEGDAATASGRLEVFALPAGSGESRRVEVSPWDGDQVRIAMLSLCRTSPRLRKQDSRCGATAPTRQAGSSATASATQPPTKSGRPPKNAPLASPAPRSRTCSAVLWRATKRLFWSRIRYVANGNGGERLRGAVLGHITMRLPSPVSVAKGVILSRR